MSGQVGQGVEQRRAGIEERQGYRQGERPAQPIGVTGERRGVEVLTVQCQPEDAYAVALDEGDLRDLLAEARFEAACGLLQGSDAPLEDIALRLGYSDVTAFTRAFRRWAGASPAAWRRDHASL